MHSGIRQIVGLVYNLISWAVHSEVTVLAPFFKMFFSSNGFPTCNWHLEVYWPYFMRPPRFSRAWEREMFSSIALHYLCSWFFMSPFSEAQRESHFAINFSNGDHLSFHCIISTVQGYARDCKETYAPAVQVWPSYHDAQPLMTFKQQFRNCSVLQCSVLMIKNFLLLYVVSFRRWSFGKEDDRKREVVVPLCSIAIRYRQYLSLYIIFRALIESGHDRLLVKIFCSKVSLWLFAESQSK